MNGDKGRETALIANIQEAVEGCQNGGRIAYLLLDLKPIHHRRKLAQDLVSLLMEFELRSNQICQITQRLWRV